MRSPSKNNRGVKYYDPKDRGTYVRIQKGNPSSSYIGQRKDYVRWQKNGKSLDKYGKVVDANTLESHIPVKDFKFLPELFK